MKLMNLSDSAKQISFTVLFITLGCLVIVGVVIGIVDCSAKEIANQKFINTISVGDKFPTKIIPSDIIIKPLNQVVGKEGYNKYVIYVQPRFSRSPQRFITVRNVDSVIVAIYTK